MNKKQLLLALIITVAVAYLLSICGCNTEKKALKKTQNYLFKHPEFSAEYCAEQFPVKDSVVVRDSLVIDTLTFIDQVANADTTVSGDTVTIVKTNTVYKYITKTVRKDSIVYRRDAAEERRLQVGLQACQENNNILLQQFTAQTGELNKWKRNAKIRWWWILLLIGGGAVYAGLRIKKSFSVKKLS